MGDGARALASGIPVHCAFDELCDPDLLVPNPRNPNRHSDAQIDLLARVIKHHGWRAPITVSMESGFVVRGHGRLLAARKLGVHQVPVDRQHYATEADEWADLVADNRLAELSEMESGVLHDVLKELEGQGYDLELTGFTGAVLDEILAALPGPGEPAEVCEGEIPEKPSNPTAKLGDLWCLGAHRILCADATVLDNAARLMEGRKAQLVFTDPPYGVRYEGGTKKREKLAGDEREGAIYSQAVPVLQWASESKAALYLWHADKVAYNVHKALRDAKYDVRAVIIWNKNHAQFGALSAQYHQKHEACIYAHRRGVAPYWYGPTNEVTVWDAPVQIRNDLHPTMKPVEFAARAMRNSSRPGDLVIDFFLGSGTTIVAAEQLGRQCYAMEIDPGYVDVAVARWEQLTGRKATRQTA